MNKHVKKLCVCAFVVCGFSIIGCSTPEVDDYNTDNNNYADNFVGEAEFKFSQDNVEVYLGETKDIYIETTDKSKLNAGVTDSNVIDVRWDRDSDEVDNKITVNITGMSYGKAAIVVSSGNTEKIINVSVISEEIANPYIKDVDGYKTYCKYDIEIEKGYETIGEGEYSVTLPDYKIKEDLSIDYSTFLDLYETLREFDGKVAKITGTTIEEGYDGIVNTTESEVKCYMKDGYIYIEFWAPDVIAYNPNEEIIQVTIAQEDFPLATESQWWYCDDVAILEVSKGVFRYWQFTTAFKEYAFKNYIEVELLN